MFLILLVVLSVWAVVGFIFWIPILFRATTVFSALVVHAAFTKQDPYSMRHTLETACGFYFRGFRSAFDVIFNPDDKSNAPPIKLHLGLVIFETFWTLLFWVVFILFISPMSFNLLVFIQNLFPNLVIKY
jgi:hypothetical protein